MLREVELQPAGRRDDERDDAALLPTPGGVLGGRASPPPGPRAWGAALVDGMRREPLLARTLAGVFVGALLGAAVRRAAPHLLAPSSSSASPASSSCASSAR